MSFVASCMAMGSPHSFACSNVSSMWVLLLHSLNSCDLKISFQICFTSLVSLFWEVGVFLKRFLMIAKIERQHGMM